MELFIENKLSEYKTHIIDYATLKSILVNMNYENINDKIANLKQKGIIKSLKKGIYIHTSCINNNVISKEILSNNLLENPSYISLDYALYYYGLIPETVHEVTAITTMRSKKFKTALGVFSYKHIKKALFGIGINIESSTNGNFLIACKEKAVCDKIFFTKGIDLRSKSAMIAFLENNLRMDIDDIEDFNPKIIAEYYKISKSTRIHVFLNVINTL